MNLPFEIDSVLQTMVNKPLVLSTNFPSSNEYQVSRELVFLPDGRIVGDTRKWEVIDGVLRLLDKEGFVTEFRTLETRNGSVYAVGRDSREATTGFSPRPILHIKKPVTDFGICISSNIHYEKIAVPRILRSLEGDGFDMSRVVVIVGNAQEDQTDQTELKVMTVRRKSDIFGLTALGNVPDVCEKPYWLLLHDTCEVTNGFVANISSVDVGLNPDVVMFRPLDDKMEIGLYASQFATKLGAMPAITKPFEYFNTVIRKARLVSVLSVPVKKEPERDVYGRGIKRETLSFPAINLKKYRAKAADIRRP